MARDGRQKADGRWKVEIGKAGDRSGWKKPSGFNRVRLAPPPQGRGGNWVGPGGPKRVSGAWSGGDTRGRGGVKKEEGGQG
jgi:hypothetical protein